MSRTLDKETEPNIEKISYIEVVLMQEAKRKHCAADHSIFHFLKLFSGFHLERSLGVS